MSEEPRTPPEKVRPQSSLTGDNSPYTFSPVTVNMNGTPGVILLGTLAIMLLVALLRALRLNRTLEAALARRTEAE